MLALAQEPIEHANLPDPERQKAGRDLQADIRATLRQALDLQKLAYDSAMALKELNDLSKDEADAKRAHAQAVSAAIKAWDISADRARIVRGKGLPRTVDVSPKFKAKVKPSMFTESKPD